jgi:hypothetical protein
MGVLSKLFGSLSGIEKELEAIHVAMFQTKLGLPPSEIKKLFRKMLKEAKEESRKEGTSNLPANFGEMLLQKEGVDKNTQAIMSKKRAEGVEDDDIRWWWGMTDLERRIMSKVDDFFKTAMYMKYRNEDSLGAEEAAKKVRKFYPFYGDPQDTTHTSGDDRPLPYEIKDRVNRYVERRSQTDSDKCQKEIQESSTSNSFVRREIRRRNI